MAGLLGGPSDYGCSPSRRERRTYTAKPDKPGWQGFSPVTGLRRVGPC